ncbi:PREDICTED: sodium-dependent phosphate transporter 2-like [Priapulus caudatus]|uniref:Phosphate transporter n=1 Tax=Priapulus caudatus TaxID=37621 RepID=A0ABM1EMP4_PRICU|nr:PREDICTED: sodium-dependent phosphate transporter 2-like [Priapulus caudatus]
MNSAGSDVISPGVGHIKQNSILREGEDELQRAVRLGEEAPEVNKDPGRQTEGQAARRRRTNRKPSGFEESSSSEESEAKECERTTTAWWQHYSADLIQRNGYMCIVVSYDTDTDKPEKPPRRAKVSDTIRNGVINPDIFEPGELMLGELAALIGSTVWLFVATWFSLPVSGTHSIVGATLGFSLVAHGSKGVDWWMMGSIVLSWFVSPVLSGIVSSVLFWCIRRFILNTEHVLERGLMSMPFFYAVTIAVNLFSIFHDGSAMLGFDKIPLYGAIILSVGTGTIVGALSWFMLAPWLRRKVTGTLDATPPSDMSAVASSAALVLNMQGLTPSTTPGVTPAQTPKHTPAHTPAASPSGSPKTRRKKKLETIEEADRLQLEQHLPAALASITPREHSDATSKQLPETGTGEVSLAPGEQGKSKKVMFQDGSSSSLESSSSSTKLFNSEKDKEKFVANGFIDLRIENEDNSMKDQATTMSDERIDSRERSDTLRSDRGTQTPMDDFESQDKWSDSPAVVDVPEAFHVFSYLQILTAVFGAFAHGGNDVSNCIGPVVAVYLIHVEQTVTTTGETPIWILMYGGVGISLGLWILGRRVIKTMGEDLTAITPTSGFSVEIGSAMTVLVASNMGIPVSTTHCKVGSVVSVGWVRSRDAVDWSLFRNIFMAWLVTVPCSGAISAGIMALFLFAF